MALLPDPPPGYPGALPVPTLDAVGGFRYPGALDGGDTITTSVSGPGFDVLGRAGAPASDAEVSIINTLLTNFPYQDPHGGWCGMFGGEYKGRGGGRLTGGTIVLFEFRTPYEVAAVAAGTHGEVPFAVTVMNASLAGGGALPPADGAAAFSGSYLSGDWSNRRFHRVLIRNDLLTGGAGAEWSGEAFLAETVMHEMGHVTQGMLMDLYGYDYVVNNTCAMLGVDPAHWSDTVHDAWEDRAIEASAEIFKDIMLEWRRYDNRTHLSLPKSRFHDWLRLYVDYFENPYWDYENTQAAFYQYNFSFGTVIGGFQGALLFLPDYTPVPHGGSAVDVFKVIALPLVGDLVTLHFNFNFTDNDWQDDFAPATPEEAAQLQAKVKLGVSFWHKDVWGTFSFDPALFIRTDQHEINPVSEPTGKGTVDIDLSGLPTDGFVMQIAFPGSAPWQFPRADSPPHIDDAVLPLDCFSALPASNPHTLPWWQWLGSKRARYLIRDITWPYRQAPDNPSVLTLGSGSAGVVRL